MSATNWKNIVFPSLSSEPASIVVPPSAEISQVVSRYVHSIIRTRRNVHACVRALVSRSTRGLLVLPQAGEQFAEALLPGAAGAALLALAADVDELGNAFPAGAARGGVVAAGEELLLLLAGLGDHLLLLGVVVLVEVVDVLLGLLDRLGLLLGELLRALRVVRVPLLAPLLNHLRLLLVLYRRTVARVVADRWARARDGTSGPDLLRGQG